MQSVEPNIADLCNGWLEFSQDKLNDVVLIPSYVATFLAKLARVNKDSQGENLITEI